MKVYEIVKAKGWTNGSGWSYETTLSSGVIEIAEIPETMDWSWYEPDENPADGTDVQVTVEYYAPDYDPMFDTDAEPLATYTVWVSELRDADGE